MPRPAKGARLGSGPSHERLLLGGLAAALIREERIRTTEAKARRLVPVADKLVTLGKSGTVHARRLALRQIEDRDLVHKLFDEVAPRFAERSGGYTRILKLGPRKGDAAPMAIVEFVEEEIEARSPDDGGKRRGLRRRRKPAPVSEQTVSGRGRKRVETVKPADEAGIAKPAEEAKPAKPAGEPSAGKENELIATPPPAVPADVAEEAEEADSE
jgi:large subunit ribosomal protein L17